MRTAAHARFECGASRRYCQRSPHHCSVPWVSVTVTGTDWLCPFASATTIVQTPDAAPAVTVNVALDAGALAGETDATVVPLDAQDAASATAVKLPAYCGSAAVSVAD